MKDDDTPTVDYGDAPTVVCMEIGRPKTLPNEMVEFPCYRFTTDSEGQLIKRLTAMLLMPISALPQAVAVGMTALSEKGISHAVDLGAAAGQLLS